MNDLKGHLLNVSGIFQKGAELGEMNLFEEVFSNNHEFFKCFRLKTNQFDRLLSMVKNRISKNWSRLCQFLLENDLLSQYGW